jgi:hypothetical protein
MTTTPEKMPQRISFSHVHLYVDHVEDILVYKDLEQRLNLLSQIKKNNPDWTLQQLAELYHHKSDGEDPFVPQNRDVVKQLLVAFGFRVTAVRFPRRFVVPCNTNSVLVTSRDPDGVQFVVTCHSHQDHTTDNKPDLFPCFDKRNLERFYKQQSGRQGVAVLAFTVESVNDITVKYEALHPKLHLRSYCGDYYGNNFRALEVFAYYEADGITADKGTVLRFMEPKNGGVPCVLPGLTPIDAAFPDDAQPAFCDHWVSNVFSRTGFAQILHETLGFVPKVDFNAGVVAAGEAQIESTVTGNSSDFVTRDRSLALHDQSQVYLPINNALSEVGHVYGFLQQIGQGIQHVASRVEDLVAFCQRANEYRQITGEGVTFLQIPRSYYGILTIQQMTDKGVSSAMADAVLEACEHLHIVACDGAVDLDLEREEIDRRLRKHMLYEFLDEYNESTDVILDTILKSRYINLHTLLEHHVSEESYLGIVRNQILVDVQGDDLLYQIFTSNILQRQAGEEAPFLEFIQRVCSECRDQDGCPVKVKPGCGGFGIRNFLTLFLSIEVSKATMELSEAKARGDITREAFAQQRVDCFTAQLNEANPILTDISRAMTKEGYAMEKLREALAKGDNVEVGKWQAEKEEAMAEKVRGNGRLMDCSTKYLEAMKTIREQHVVS